MKKTIITFPETKLIGIAAKTNNMNEMNPLTAKIGPTIQSYIMNNVPSQIPGRKNPNVNYCVYTDYEINKIDYSKCEYHGDYTYFIGEAVKSFDNSPNDLKIITIPEQKYVKFTTSRGPMPGIVISAWMEIWSMTAEALGAERSFNADFEIYDERALNPLDAEADIYIGIR